MSRAVPSFSYENFNGKIGNSDIHGDLKYVASQPRPKLSGASWCPINC
jgi:AsmA family protein